MGNFQTCGPNEAMIKSGVCADGTDGITVGGRTFCLAFGLQFVQKISLNTITLEISSQNVNSQRGVPVCAVGIAQIKVGNTKELLRISSQLYLGKKLSDAAMMVEQVAKETMEGHQRAIIGNMTVEEMFRDKRKFSEEVTKTANIDMMKLGLQIVSYTVKQLYDNNGYLRALGEPEIAQTQSRQRIAEAQNRMEADVKKAEANQLEKVAQYEADLQMVEANLVLELRKAKNQKEIGKQTATADLATRLQDALTRQEVIEQEMQIKVIERQREIKVQEEEVKKVDQELQANCIKPAEAEVYQITTGAQAERKKIIAESEAEADTIKLKGDAEAYAILEEAKGEAEQLKMKAKAFKQYKEGALVDLVLKTMPMVAAEIAAPLNNAKKINMIASGDGEIGASRLTDEVVRIMEKLPKMIHGMTGVDITEDMRAVANNK